MQITIGGAPFLKENKKRKNSEIIKKEKTEIKKIKQKENSASGTKPFHRAMAEPVLSPLLPGFKTEPAASKIRKNSEKFPKK